MTMPYGRTRRRSASRAPARRAAPRRASTRRAAPRAQTVRIVVEQAPPNAMARPDAPFMVPGRPLRKTRF